MWLGVRTLSVMKVSQFFRYPRQYNPFINLKSLPNANPKGKISIDGCHKYEVDFLETADWVTKCLYAVKEFQPFKSNHNFKTDLKKTPICFQTITEYHYDYTMPEPLNNKVALIARVSDLNLDSQSSTSLKLICKDYYDADTDTIKIKAHETANAPPQDSCSAQENFNHLSVLFSKLISTAKEKSFEGLVIENNRKNNRNFPAEWIQKAT